MTLRSLHPTELCSLKGKARKLLQEIKREKQAVSLKASLASPEKRADEVIHALLSDLGMADLAETHKALSNRSW